MEKRDKSNILVFGNDATLEMELRGALGSEKDLPLSFFPLGADCPAKAESRLPDLILLDASEAGGLELCKTLKDRESTRWIPVLMTLSANPAAEQRAREAGADDVINRPVTADSLLPRLRIGLRLKSLQDTLLTQNAELQRLHAQLVQQEKMATVGLLAAGVSHEFNNIMTSLYGFAQLAKRNDEYEPRLVDVTLKEVERAKVIVESLLSFSKQTLDRRRDTDISRLIEDLLVLVEPEFRANRIEVKREFGTREEILVNRGQIQQVVLNLLINASQAIGRNGQIRVRTAFEKETFTLEISDNGRGMSPAQAAKVFEPFYTTKGALGGGSIPGTGLGLTVAKNIIERHGGSIGVESAPGKGTAFRIAIPLAKDRRRSREEVDSDRRSENILKEIRRSILVVEEEESLRSILREFLSIHDLSIAETPEEAEALIKEKRFDYILFDIRMPEGSLGLEILEKAQKAQPVARIIVLSGLPEGPENEPLRQKAYAYVQKPFQFNHLMALLR